MPGVKGYGGKHVEDHTKRPGKVTSGKVTAEALGSQIPLGTVSMAPKAKERAKGY